MLLIAFYTEYCKGGGCHCPETLVFSVGRTIHDIKKDRVDETGWMLRSNTLSTTGDFSAILHNSSYR